uniref:Uncharacterized protein n=1 Tax=Utricularia reniformis TaxID=192314 RepID=A0A1Y0B0W7_9LAMI|nr:hypothetical protein AEK19_MT0874 [Utricularia reniformis]ART31106.1 hypothetical protein AEK19_MT0874 [Utricularia reniformis]
MSRIMCKSRSDNCSRIAPAWLLRFIDCEMYRSPG